MHAIPLACLLCLIAAVSAADDAACHQSVVDRDYGRTISACLELPHGNRLAVVEALSSGKFDHHLGTLERPSQAFALLRAHAATGNVSAQYLYGALYSMVHVRTTENWDADAAPGVPLGEYNQKVRASAAVWTRKAADNGHKLAMLDMAEYYLGESYNDPETDLSAALAYARGAEQGNPALAGFVIEKIERRIAQLKN